MRAAGARLGPWAPGALDYAVFPVTGNLERLRDAGVVRDETAGADGRRRWSGGDRVSRVRVGAVGAGWWATSNHFPILAARDDVELVGVCGIGPELEAVREQFGFGMATRTTTSCSTQELDAVVITTPHDLHYPQAVAAIERGLHVLVEKPVTLEPRGGWDLVRRVERRACTSSSRTAGTTSPSRSRRKRLVDDGLVGDIQYVLCHMASPTRGLFAGDPTDIMQLWDSETERPRSRTWQSPARGGGYAHGQITHSSALLFWLFDRPARRDGDGEGLGRRRGGRPLRRGAS